MSYSLTLARIIGPSCLLIGLAMVIKPIVFREAMAEFTHGGQKMLLLLAGAVHVILGLLLITTHWAWSWDWPVLITIIGCLLFLRGLFLLYFPERIKLLANSLHDRPWWPYLAGGILVVLGLLLLYYVL